MSDTDKIIESVVEMIPDFDSELIAIQSTFESLISKDVVVKPFLVPFDLRKKKPFVSFVRDWNTELMPDYYTAIAELLFMVPCADIKSMILAIHPKTNPFFNMDNQFPLIYDNSIVLFCVSEDWACACEVEYTINNNNVVWTTNHNYFEIAEIADPFVECLFIFSHVDSPPFNYLDMLDFLSNNGYSVMISDASTYANKTYHLEKGVYSS